MHDAAAPHSPGQEPSDDPFRALESEIRVLIRRAQSSAAQTARRVHPELEASAYPLLAHIDSNPGLRGSDLAAHFGVGRATVSRQLSRLVELGLVHREVDPEDTRGQRITLTADGAARFARARDRRIEMYKSAFGDWDPADVARLAELMHQYSTDIVRWRDANQ